MAILLLVALLPNLLILGVQSIGVCYGRNGNNLPSPQDVINLYKDNGITNLRIYDPNPEVLNALRGSNIEIIIDIPNYNLQALTDPNAATNWVHTNIINYFPSVKIKYIAVGNEVSPGFPQTAQFAPFILPAMQNVQRAIAAYGVQNQIKVSTVMYSGVLTNTYPPWNAVFRDDLKGFIVPIVQFLAHNGSPLLANIYPYFAYRGDPAHVALPYALFTQSGADPGSGYHNLFDAMLDAQYYALEKAGGNNIEIVVAESGWPSDGGFGASMENAGTYYINLNNHVKSGRGTPYKSGKAIETYLFAMFDENLKEGDVTEKHYGVFYPNKAKKYNINFQ